MWSHNVKIVWSYDSDKHITRCTLTASIERLERGSSPGSDDYVSLQARPDRRWVRLQPNGYRQLFRRR